MDMDSSWYVGIDIGMDKGWYVDIGVGVGRDLVRDIPEVGIWIKVGLGIKVEVG